MVFAYLSYTWIFSQSKQQKSIYPGDDELKKILGRRNQENKHINKKH